MKTGLEHVRIETAGNSLKEISGKDLAPSSQPALGQKAPSNVRGRPEIEQGTAQLGMLRKDRRQDVAISTPDINERRKAPEGIPGGDLRALWAVDTAHEGCHRRTARGIGLDPVEEAHAIDGIERWLTRGEDVRQSPPPSRNRLIVQHGDHVPQRVGHIAAQM